MEKVAEETARRVSKLTKGTIGPLRLESAEVSIFTFNHHAIIVLWVSGHPPSPQGEMLFGEDLIAEVHVDGETLNAVAVEGSQEVSPCAQQEEKAQEACAEEDSTWCSKAAECESQGCAGDELCALLAAQIEIPKASPCTSAAVQPPSSDLNEGWTEVPVRKERPTPTVLPTPACIVQMKDSVPGASQGESWMVAALIGEKGAVVQAPPRPVRWPATSTRTNTLFGRHPIPHPHPDQGIEKEHLVKVDILKQTWQYVVKGRPDAVTKAAAACSKAIADAAHDRALRREADATRTEARLCLILNIPLMHGAVACSATPV